MAQQQKRAYVYAVTKSGATVRIPAERAAAWQRTQERLESGRETPEDRQTVGQLASALRAKLAAARS